MWTFGPHNVINTRCTHTHTHTRLLSKLLFYIHCRDTCSNLTLLLTENFLYEVLQMRMSPKVFWQFDQVLITFGYKFVPNTHAHTHTLQSARRHRTRAFAHSSRLGRTAVKSRPQWGQWACRWASMRRFLTVCAEILWLCKPIVAAAVRVAGLRRSWRWRCWMWRSWAGVVTRGLRLWGRLNCQNLWNAFGCGLW